VSNRVRAPSLPQRRLERRDRDPPQASASGHLRWRASGLPTAALPLFEAVLVPPRVEDDVSDQLGGAALHEVA
jgi:hypothetical protein